MTGPDVLFDVLAGLGARSAGLAGWRAYRIRTSGVDRWSGQSAAVTLDAIAAASRISRAAYDARRAMHEEVQRSSSSRPGGG